MAYCCNGAAFVLPPPGLLPRGERYEAFPALVRITYVKNPVNVVSGEELSPIRFLLSFVVPGKVTS